MQKKPNILWFCSDRQRFDTIRCMNNQYINTPNLDRLIERGVGFERAYTQTPVCTPSRATFLTGQYPATHHIHRNGNDYVPEGTKLVTKIFQEAGYDCGLVGKLHLSGSQGRFEQRTDDGYRYFKWSHHPTPDLPEHHDYADWLKQEKHVDPVELYEPYKGILYGPGLPAEYSQTTWCTEMAMRFISEDRDGPWMLSMNPFDPHPPYDPPKEFLDRYNPVEIPYPLFREHDIERQKEFAHVDQQTMEAVNPYEAEKQISSEWGEKYDAYPGRVPPKHYDARKLKACYYASIEFLDYQLGRLLTFLEERGELDNTIIVFHSDHGELLGDHGLLGLACRFFDSLVRVPLIISWPALFQSGVQSKAMVELVDLAPTLLEAAGLEVPATIQGKSLVPLLSGQIDNDFHKPYVVCDYNDALDRPNGSHGTMYFNGRYKSIMYHDQNIGELYDMSHDPGEFENLWDDSNNKQLRYEILKEHFNALMLTSSAGVPRIAPY